jgi:ABC-type transport system substrate-binding protein
MKFRIFGALTIIGIVALLLVSGNNTVYGVPFENNLKTGPYVDNVVYKVITSQDQRILTLQAGIIEMDTNFFDPVHFPALDADPDINLFSALRNGYGHLTINCRDYPLNISGLRRAFAFAYDKTRVTTEIMDGFNQEHDSIVPYVNGWCVEDEFTYHYYTNQSSIGNQILDDLGFEIDAGTGYRLAPNGDPFDIVIEYASTSPEIAGGVAQIGVDALHALHIDARTQASDFNEYISRLDSHGDYDMIFYAQDFHDNDVDWLAYEYWSAYADTPYQNPSNFVNVTYDYWRDQLLYGTTYMEVFEAAEAMQHILHENVPRLVVYENTYLQAYRNDQFTGHVEDFSGYISGPWTMRKIHNLDDTLGGTVPVAIGQEPDSFNFFISNSAYSGHIFKNLHASLYKYGPDMTPVGDLAKALLVETHEDNVAVPAGHTRYTIDIIQNASWSDGTPLTAEDVAFTFTYHVESGLYGNPAGIDLGDLVASYAPTTYRVVLEFSTESYWQFSCFAFDYIIPVHIFNDSDGIGYMGWNTWNPVFDSAEPNVNCGPFILTDFEAGEYYEISKNPDYHYFPQELTSTTSTTSSSTTTTTTPIPSTEPLVDAPVDISYQVGTTGHEIVWTASDDNPLLYMVFQDNLPIISDVWDGGNIHVDIDGLSIGTYNYTLLLMDGSANIAYDTVWVTVTSGTTTSPTGLPDNIMEIVIIAVSAGSVLTILIVAVAIFRKR